MSKELHYLDACIFLGFLNSVSEPNTMEECRNIIRAGEEGKINVITSAFSMSEVVNIKDPNNPGRMIESDLAEDIISKLFVEGFSSLPLDF